MTTHSDAYRRFLDSTQVSHAGWRDGDGYDLESLAQVEGEERQAAERLLLERMKSRGGWREIEALARLGTPGAKQAIRAAAAADASDCATRLHAAEQLAEWGEDIQVDRYILSALHADRMNAGAAYALDAAVRFPTAYLRNGLTLDLARDGAEECSALHAAAQPLPGRQVGSSLRLESAAVRSALRNRRSRGTRACPRGAA